MIIVVEDDQLSLAIGKGGQNARLAAKLTGWKVNILSETDFFDRKREEAESKIEVSKLEIGEATIQKLIEHDYKFIQDILEVAPSQLTEIDGIGPVKADQIVEAAREHLFRMQAERAEAEQLKAEEEEEESDEPRGLSDLFVDDVEDDDDEEEEEEKAETEASEDEPDGELEASADEVDESEEEDEGDDDDTQTEDESEEEEEEEKQGS